MKILIVYYSRTHKTDKIAKTLQNNLNCDIEKIDDYNKHKGIIGYLKGGFESATKKGCEIAPIIKDPSNYDLVIIGTPVWASNMASPIISYLENNKDKIKNIGCFCTCGGSGYKKTIENIATLSNKPLKASFYLTKKEVDNPNNKINEFIQEIKDQFKNI